MNSEVTERIKLNNVMYQEIIKGLSKLSEKELFSYYLTSSDKQVIQTVLDYKDKKDSAKDIDVPTKFATDIDVVTKIYID